jgi:aryl-alcohol dehydrogenase-like predicted oxidoreductase
MEKRELGTTEIMVPVIGMGTWKTFDVSGSLQENKRQEIVNTAYRNGSILYDSSPMYGQAEQVLGKAVSQLGIRKDVLIATKVWTESDAKSLEQFDDSFRYFGGYIDLYQVHNLVEWRKRLSQLEEHKKEGRVKAIGITHYLHSGFPEMMEIMRTMKIVDFIQIPYNVMNTEVEKEVLPLAESLGMGVIIMQPFGVGKLIKGSPTNDEMQPLREFGINTWPQALLKFILSDRRVTAVIPATSHQHHMIDNCEAGSGPLFDNKAKKYALELAKKYC